jgi:hypothetical protein
MGSPLNYFSDLTDLRIARTRVNARKYYLCAMKSIQEYISEVEDFWIEKKCLHKLFDILLIGLFTYLSNGEDYEDMVIFAQSHKEFLRPYAELPNGIPSHDTFRRVFSLLEPDIISRSL